MKRTQMMMTVIVAAASFLVTVSPRKSMADDVKIGVILGFAGPIESLTPDMAAGAELAMKEVNDSGAFGQLIITSVRGDSTCVDAAAATAAAERLITSDKVRHHGADCSV